MEILERPGEGAGAYRKKTLTLPLSGASVPFNANPFHSAVCMTCERQMWFNLRSGNYGQS